MARIGMQGMKYGLFEVNSETAYQEPKEFKGAISAEISPNIASANLYADDELMEYASAFQDATITLTAADDTDDVFADLLGRTKEGSRWITTINDKVPYVGYGYIVSKIIDGIPKFLVQFFPKVKFSQFVPSAGTKGESMDFKTISVDGKILANKYGIWESHITVSDLTSAQTELDNYFTNPLVEPIAPPVITSPVNGATDVPLTPTITGTGKTGATVTVKSGSSIILTSITVSGSGTWTGTVSTALAADTDYTITASQTAGASTSPESDPVTFHTAES
jgi:phi13 family phage major tail protein